MFTASIKLKNLVAYNLPGYRSAIASLDDLHLSAPYRDRSGMHPLWYWDTDGCSRMNIPLFSTMRSARRRFTGETENDQVGSQKIALRLSGSGKGTAETCENNR